MPMTEAHRREYDLANRLDEEFQDACLKHYGEPAVCCRKPGEPLAEHLRDLSARRRASIERLNDHCRMQREEPARRAELDSELQAMGAVVIRVEDLEKAMEAYEAGYRGSECVRAAFVVCEGMAYDAGNKNRQVANVQHARRSIHAVHLARLALGEHQSAPTEDDLCEECGADIRTGYSWERLCVVCAERFHNPEHPDFALGEPS